MTEREIQLLGFVRWDEDSDPSATFHYYTYTVCRGFEFISCSSDEIAEDGSWWVEFFETEPAIRFHKFEELQALINLIEKRVVR